MREWTLKRGLDVTCPKCKGIIMGNRDEQGIVVVNPRHERPRYYHKYCYITKLMREFEDSIKKAGGTIDMMRIEGYANEHLQWLVDNGMAIVKSWE